MVLCCLEQFLASFYINFGCCFFVLFVVVFVFELLLFGLCFGLCFWFGLFFRLCLVVVVSGSMLVVNSFLVRQLLILDYHCKECSVYPSLFFCNGWQISAIYYG